jgi:hypothetical protein
MESNIIISVGETYNLKLPSITDPDGDTYTVNIENFTKIATFTKIMTGKYMIAPTMNGQVGVYKVAIVLKD